MDCAAAQIHCHTFQEPCVPVTFKLFIYFFKNMAISSVHTLELSRTLKKKNNPKGTLVRGFSPDAFTVDLGVA